MWCLNALCPCLDSLRGMYLLSQYFIPSIIVSAKGPDVTSITGSSLLISFSVDGSTFNGSAIAVSNTLALTALHGKATVGTKVAIRDIRGHLLAGDVVFCEFEKDYCDIAVLKLSKEYKFCCSVQVCRTPVKLEQELHIIGLQTGYGDVTYPFSEISRVRLIEGSTMFQSTYYSFQGCSGIGIVTVMNNDHFEVVGVHVASHDSTIGIDHEAKATLKKLKTDLVSICSELHGHSAYSLICEASRVAGLLAFLDECNAS